MRVEHVKHSQCRKDFLDRLLDFIPNRDLLLTCCFQSARQRDQEDRGQDHWKEGCSMQEAATGELHIT